MKIKINHNLLTDSPYSEDTKGLFINPGYEARELILDIKFGQPTCYLISGYRGVGKSSFVRMVEEGIKDEEKTTESKKNSDEKKRETVFIHCNFSKYKQRSYVLRNLIRGLYLVLSKDNTFKTIKKRAVRGENQETNYALLLERLYEKTFFETSSSNTDSIKDVNSTTIEIDWKLFTQTFIATIATILFFINLQSRFIFQNNIINLILTLFSSSLCLLKFLQIKKTISTSRSVQQELNRKSLYDDEIADYHFYELLSGLHTDFKTVFVLDELDKLDEITIDQLLSEIKPYLVSGAATFIVVAGQDLAYKHWAAKRTDDALLSSLFSKRIHIPLMATESFHLIFDKLIDIKKTDLDPEEILLIRGYVDSLIFKCRRIPRAFIGLIRQNLSWQENEVYINIRESVEQMGVFTTTIDLLEVMYDTDIAPRGYEEPIKDFIIMKLYLRSEQILREQDTFTMEKLISDEQRSN